MERCDKNQVIAQIVRDYKSENVNVQFCFTTKDLVRRTELIVHLPLTSFVPELP